jgi:Xaa-Pro aminopeptidase
MSKRLAVKALLMVSACALVAGAQVPASEYATRRAALAASIDSGVIVAFGGVEPVNYWPTFYQLPSFQYLTGFGETDAVLLMVKRNGSTRSMLFVPTRDAVMSRWVGSRTPISEIPNKVPGATGHHMGELVRVADSLGHAGLKFYVVSDVQTTDYAAEDSLTRGAKFMDWMRGRRAVVPQSIDSVVHRLRAKKSAGEVALLRRATEISVKAHQEVMKAVGPGCYEYEIQALMEGTFRRMGADRPGYGSIVGSGPNATILHYMEDTRMMNDGELLLIDAAASYQHYSSDVTRTMPVNGKFTAAQREIYQLVRDAQEAYVRQIKPGSLVSASNDSARNLVRAGLARLGLIESPDATYDPPPGVQCPPTGCLQRTMYVLHGYGGHGIGLEVHDPAQYATEGAFKPGDVFTVEPGIYVDPNFLGSLPDTPKNRAMMAKIRPAVEKYKWIGVRIEDVYAVNERGVEWQSAGAPREIAEIEALMAQPRKPELPGGGSCGRPKS